MHIRIHSLSGYCPYHARIILCPTNDIFRGKFYSKPAKDPFASFELNNTIGWKDCDWELPTVTEETIDRIATMMTIYPK
jgi:hypothetical protein